MTDVMTLKKFRMLRHRDYANHAVLDAIDRALELLEDYEHTNLPQRIRELEAQVNRWKRLCYRSQAIITNAIVHGMPITKEVAAVRNAINGVWVEEEAQ